MGEIARAMPSVVEDFFTRLIPKREARVFSELHLNVASLLSQGAVSRVVTPNFDECIEAAADALGCPLRVANLVPGTAVAVADQVVKIHGTIADYGSLAVSVPALAMRANTAAWREEVAGALEGCLVLFVGYGFNDVFDIVPALQIARSRGAVFARASRTPDGTGASADYAVQGFIGGANDVISTLFAALTGQIPPRPTARALSPALQLEIARRSAEDAFMQVQPRVASRLWAYARLMSWVDNGPTALALATHAASQEGDLPSRGVADAAVRAHRYATAMHEYARLVHAASRINQSQLADLLSTAAHCASSAGWTSLASRLYASAGEAWTSRPTHPPVVADRYLRGRAEHEIRLAQRSVRARSRNQHLANAGILLQTLRSSLSEPAPPTPEVLAPGLLASDDTLKTATLILVDEGRILIEKRRLRAARRRLTQARSVAIAWRDPHDTMVITRLLALAEDRKARRQVRQQLTRAARQREWVEALKFALVSVRLLGPWPWEPAATRLEAMLISVLSRLK